MENIHIVVVVFCFFFFFSLSQLVQPSLFFLAFVCFHFFFTELAKLDSFQNIIKFL
jgi:hypothetical protein